MSDFDARLRELLGELDAADAARVTPPPSVWVAIAAEVSTPVATAEPDAPRPHATPVVPRPPTSLADRTRRSRLTWMLAAAAAVILTVGVALIVDERRAGDPDVIAVVQVRSDGLAGAAPGLESRAVIEESDGVRRIAIDASAIDVGEGEFVELWLINDDITDMVSLGMVRRGATYEIPADVELEDFPIIDLSIEPDDGVPTHSGRSVLRGRLEV